MTEKHHCQNLLLIQKVFVESLERHFNLLNRDRLFPRLAELTELHTGSVRMCFDSTFFSEYPIDLFLHSNYLIFYCFRNRFLKKLRKKQKENYIVDSIADLLVDFFSNQTEQLISAYGKCIFMSI